MFGTGHKVRALELLSICVWLLTRSGTILGSENGPGDKVVVKEGSDAVLPCSLNTKENIVAKLFDWRKDEIRKEVFIYDSGIHYNNGRPGQDEQFRGRVSHFQDQLKNGDASIKITKTKMADSGNYSCIFPNLQRQTFNIELVVGAAPRPFIATLAETKDWSLLQCEAHGDPLPTVEWKDSDNNTLHTEKPQVSERGGRLYVTVNITLTKTGSYRCVATQEKFSHQIAAVTFVHLTGAASKPSVTILDQTKDWSLLQCEVVGASPKPKVEWRDSSGNILPVKDVVTERGDSYDIVLQTTVTKTDNFSCVVTQEAINHRTDAYIYVHMSGSNGTVIALVVVSLLLVAAVVGGVVAGFYIRHLRKENRQKDEEKREPQSEPDSSTSLKESS